MAVPSSNDCMSVDIWQIQSAGRLRLVLHSGSEYGTPGLDSSRVI
jgi:hypothetical protein